jgi:protein SCO1/2
MVQSSIGPVTQRALAFVFGIAAAMAASATPSPADFRDEWGRPVDLDALRGHPVVATMAYTTCRRACPVTISTLRQLQQTLEARGETVEFVVIGFDPANDDPQAWRDYRAHHGIEGEHWHFLTGTPASTRNFGQRFGFRYWQVDEHVMHEQRVIVLDGHGALVGSDDRLSLPHLLELLQAAGGPAGTTSSSAEVRGP